MKLEVGMYVRTKDGIIARIKEIDNNERLYLNQKSIYTDDYKHDLIIDYEVIKASYNIIDILEVGDYVNGSKVVEVDFDAEEEKYIRIDKAQDGLKTILRNNDIKSIVTKEMYSSVEYRMETN